MYGWMFIMLVSHEKRRREPSYSIPFFFEGLEIVLIWIVFSLFEGSINIFDWSIISYSLSAVWFIYTFYKLRKVLNRQMRHKI